MKYRGNCFKEKKKKRKKSNICYHHAGISVQNFKTGQIDNILWETLKYQQVGHKPEHVKLNWDVNLPLLHGATCIIHWNPLGSRTTQSHFFLWLLIFFQIYKQSPTLLPNLYMQKTIENRLEAKYAIQLKRHTYAYI